MDNSQHHYTTAVSVIIPAYNEECGIGAVLEIVNNVMTEAGIPCEILVVDDGSKDGTASEAEKHAGVTVLRHRTNKGYGAALKTGIRHSSYDLICITDADGTYPNKRIPELAGIMQHRRCDMVVGARTGRKAKIPLVRRPAKYVIGLLAQFVAGAHIADVNSGLRIFKKDAALKFFGILPDGFSFTTTITLAMMTNNYFVEFEQIQYTSRIGSSKIRPIRDTISFAQLVMRMALYFAPLKFFLPISFLVILMSVGWGAYTHFVAGQLADVSTLIVMITGVQIAVFGTLAELVNKRLPSYHREE